MLNKKALAASLSAKETDADFKQTVLLLHGDGTNGAQNNTFTDSSTNAFTITRNGNTTQGTFSPFSQTGWSNYFDGSGDYLQLADSTAWDLSGDYTIEMWINVSAISSSPTFFQIGSSSLLWYISSATKYLTTTGSLSMTASTAITLNSWNHIAICRSGSSTNNTKMYLNGVKVAETTNTTSFTGDGSNGLRIGAEYPSNYYLNGYISNLRVVNGTAVYTADFTPPTAALTAITNTSLLTCQSNRFVDNSSNAFAITVNGDTSVQAFSPFAPTDAYSAGTNGGSGYFDGSGDYLSIANDTKLDVGTGVFTIEFWCYQPTQNSYGQIFGNANSGAIDIVAYGGTLGLGRQFIASDDLRTAAGTLPAGQWAHCVVVRNSSNNTALFINGTRGAYSASNTNNYGLAGGAAQIGWGNTGYSYAFSGYISGFRLVKGTAVYDPTQTTLTVPTAPPTAIANTNLLTNFTNAGIIDQTGKNVLETVGNAQIDTATKKFGTGSLEFDGTGDYLVMGGGQSQNFAFGSGDFTIEMWIYFNAVNSTQTFFDGRPQGSNGAYPLIYLNSNGTIRYFVDSSDRVTGTTSLSASTWYHLAISRSGTSTKMFLNGTQEGSTYTDSNSYLGTTNRPIIGTNLGDGSSTQALNGFIDDLRITKGVARYTANFTVPSKAFADQ